jgi:hypothetical protein
MRLERARNILFPYFFAMDSFIYAPKKKKEKKRKKKKKKQKLIVLCHVCLRHFARLPPLAQPSSACLLP